MRYVEQGPTDAPDVTVLLHGWPDSSYSFSRLTPTLAAYQRRLSQPAANRRPIRSGARHRPRPGAGGMAAASR